LEHGPQSNIKRIKRIKLNKMQTKRHSMLESITNVAVGFVITLVCSPFIYTLCGMEYTWGQLGWVTVIFTALSIVRSYIIRRFFNKKTIKEVNQEVL
jgi:membrane protein implicated in regulation of membrane protease activity